MNNNLLIILFIVFAIILWIMLKSASQASEKEVEMKAKDIKVDKSLKHVNTYFFTKNRFDFEKFCNYILCINEDMSISEIADTIMELDLLLKCSADLNDKIISILIYSEGIVGLDYKEFDNLKESIRCKLFKGTYQDLVFIFMNTIFYLKYQLAKKQDKYWVKDV